MKQNRIVVEVRETNLAVQLFFRDAGFRAVSVLRNHYEETPEDAYVMEYQYRCAEGDAAVSVNRISGFFPVTGFGHSP